MSPVVQGDTRSRREQATTEHSVRRGVAEERGGRREGAAPFLQLQFRMPQNSMSERSEATVGAATASARTRLAVSAPAGQRMGRSGAARTSTSAPTTSRTSRTVASVSANSTASRSPAPGQRGAPVVRVTTHKGDDGRVAGARRVSAARRPDRAGGRRQDAGALGAEPSAHSWTTARVALRRGELVAMECSSTGERSEAAVSATPTSARTTLAPCTSRPCEYGECPRARQASTGAGLSR